MSFIDVNKTDEELTAEMLAEIPDKYQKTVGFFIWDFLRAVAIGLNEIWIKLKYIACMDDLNNFEYDDLVRFVKQRRGIIAKKETYASGPITVLTGEGTISKGDLFETPDGLQFESIETKEVAEGGIFEAKCLTAGPEGNVPKEAVTVIPKTITGIVKVSNLSEMSGGYNKESKESIIERYLEDLQNPITSGNIYHYKKWAKEVAGVGEADVKPLWNGDNTVKVIIVDSELEPADEKLVKDVQDYIDPFTLGEDCSKVGWGCGNGQAPIGAYCTVESAKALNLTITFKAILKTGQTPENAETASVNEIRKYLHETAFNNDYTYISYAKIGSCLLQADGIEDYTDLLVNGGTDNIPIINNDIIREVAVLDSLTLSEA